MPMKIRQIYAIGLYGATPEGGWDDELEKEDCVHTLIVVETSDDLVGLGSVFTSDSLVNASLELLESLYADENPLEPERVSEKLRQNTFWTGRGGSVTHTISGIDIALWDILGQATGQTIGRLLGGCYRDQVQPYASILMDEPEVLSEHLTALKSQGFRAFKIGWGLFGRQDSSHDEAIIRAAREAVGPESRLMVDAGGSNAFWPNDYKWALRTATMLAEHDVYWFEEPLTPDALEDYILLRQQVPVRIAGGEVLTRRQSFQPWLQRRALDIVQPDVTKVGGISEARKIAWMAQENNIRYIPHGWNTAVGVAADLQLAAAFAGTDTVEYLTGAPYVDDLKEGGWSLNQEGLLEIPRDPGLGITLNLDMLEKYSKKGDFTEVSEILRRRLQSG